MSRCPGQLKRGGRDHADDGCGHARHKAVQGRVLDDGLQMVEQHHREGEGWQENSGRDRQGACPAADHIAGEGAENHQRRRQDAGQSHPVQKDAIWQPTASDGISAHIGDSGIGAAKCQQAAFQSGGEQGGELRRRLGRNPDCRRCDLQMDTEQEGGDNGGGHDGGAYPRALL
ncbi:hypothetical protein D3C72_1685530 [compost metagenome]